MITLREIRFLCWGMLSASLGAMPLQSSEARVGLVCFNTLIVIGVLVAEAIQTWRRREEER